MSASGSHLSNISPIIPHVRIVYLKIKHHPLAISFLCATPLKSEEIRDKRRGFVKGEEKGNKEEDVHGWRRGEKRD